MMPPRNEPWQRRWLMTSAVHLVTWGLSKAAIETYWTLGTSALGTDTRLVF